MKPGDRVIHRIYGPGLITARDLSYDPVAKKTVDTTRVGVVFDQHTLLANPAYFWQDELTLIKEA